MPLLISFFGLGFDSPSFTIIALALIGGSFGAGTVFAAISVAPYKARWVPILAVIGAGMSWGILWSTFRWLQNMGGWYDFAWLSSAAFGALFVAVVQVRALDA